jgi:ATP-dependent Clp protease ATP-binding subunit ClpB
VIDDLCKNGFQPEFGARPIKRLINRDILSKISKYILERPDVVSIWVIFDKEIRIEDGSKDNLKKAG